jgi:hypothetical protein
MAHLARRERLSALALFVPAGADHTHRSYSLRIPLKIAEIYPFRDMNKEWVFSVSDGS